MKYVIVFVILIASFSSYASNVTCSLKGTRVIYTNGVLTNKDKAKEAVEKIIYLVNKDNADYKRISIDKKITAYRLAFNYQESIAKDVLEAAVQRLPVSYIDALKVQNAYEAYSYFLQGKFVELISQPIRNEINEKKLDLISVFSQNFVNMAQYTTSLAEIKLEYNDAIKNNERIFAISHSQGGLFMNEMFNILPENYKKKYFSGFQVASPLEVEINGHFGYATHSKDRVINLVRMLIGALPANLNTPLIVNTAKWDDDVFLNHGILTTYLYDEDLKKQVLENLIETANKLDSNCLVADFEVVKNENMIVTLDASKSNGEDLRYEWDFGDDKKLITEEKVISHTFSKNGIYLVRLKVTNEFGSSQEIETNIEVKKNDNFEDVFMCAAAEIGIVDSVRPIYFNIDAKNLGIKESFTLTSSINGTCECRKVKLPKYTGAPFTSLDDVAFVKTVFRMLDGTYRGSSGVFYSGYAPNIYNIFYIGSYYQITFYSQSGEGNLSNYGCTNIIYKN